MKLNVRAPGSAEQPRAMHRVSATSSFILALCASFCGRVTCFITSSVAVRVTRWPDGSLLMTADSSRPRTRGEAIAAIAAASGLGLLATATTSGVSGAGAAVPEALPACPADSNCVSSTSFKLVQQGRYMAPWYYGDDVDGSDASAAFSKLLAAVENDPQLKVVEKDPEGLYIAALAKSAVPPDGFDKVEFLFKPKDGLVSFRSKSLKDTYAGPVLVGDGNSNRNRMTAFRKKLGWPERGIDDYMRNQGIDSGSSRAKGYLSEFGWRKAETQSYGEEDDDF